MIRRVLVSAFEPWGKNPVNSSAVAVEPLTGRTVLGARIEVVVLPVDAEASIRNLREAAQKFGPDAVVCFGMRRDPPDAWHVELIARNRFSADDRDPREIVPGGAGILPSGLPVARIHGALLEAGIRAEFSEDAGTFVCNHLFYQSMRDAAERVLPERTGFVHVSPPAGPKEDQRPENFESLREGALRVVEAVIGRREDRG